MFLIPPRFIYQYSLFFRHSFHCFVCLILSCGTTLTCSRALLLPGQGLSPFPGLQLRPCPDRSVKLPSPAFPHTHRPLSSQLPVPSRPNTKSPQSLPSPRDPLPRPTSHLEFPHVPSSQPSHRSLLHLPFLTCLSLQQYAVKAKENS